MIIMIGGQKGGSGKSTIAINLAVALANQEHDVCLLDADRQSTASVWHNRREQKPRVHCVQKYDNIKNTLFDLNDRYQYVIVDSAGRDSSELRSGLLAAHVLVIPFRPSQADLDTLPEIRKIVNQSIIYNPDLKAFAVLTMGPTNIKISESSEAKEYLAECYVITLLETIISDRKVYRDSLGEGLGVLEMSNEKAKNEINSLLSEIKGKIND